MADPPRCPCKALAPPAHNNHLSSALDELASILHPHMLCMHAHTPAHIGRSVKGDLRGDTLETPGDLPAVAGEGHDSLLQIHPHTYPVTRGKHRCRLPITHELVSVAQEALRVIEPVDHNAPSASGGFEGWGRSRIRTIYTQTHACTRHVPWTQDDGANCQSGCQVWQHQYHTSAAHCRPLPPPILPSQKYACIRRFSDLPSPSAYLKGI